MDPDHGPASIWALARDAIFPPEAFDAAPVQVARLLSLAAVTDDVDVLDMPCGPGRHALPLARVGHRVVAVDLTPSYCDELRERAAAMRAGGAFALEVVEADMREFVREDAFDLALNLYHSFGYFEDPADDARVLGNLRRSLRSGGALVVDLMSAELLAKDFEPVRALDLPGGGSIREESHIDGRWMTSSWVVARDGVEHRRDMSHRLYSAGELTAALESAGFGDVALHGGFDGRPWGEGAVRLVVVAR